MAGSVTTAFSLDHLLTVSDTKCTDVILLDKQVHLELLLRELLSDNKI